MPCLNGSIRGHERRLNDSPVAQWLDQEQEIRCSIVTLLSENRLACQLACAAHHLAYRLLLFAEYLTQTRRDQMAVSSGSDNSRKLSREGLVDLLNEDLAREFQAVISYVVYSQVLKGAQYMNIAKELEVHAKEELEHALLIARQIDYLGGMPLVTPKPVRTSKNTEDMLRFDLENENETIRNYRQRVAQCESLGEFAIAETIRQILLQEQDHQIALATALGIEVPNAARSQEH